MSSVAYQPHDPLEGVDAEGMIVTGARRSAVHPEFVPVLEQAVEALKRLGHGTSLYLYGSVATGRSRVGSSDVDLVTIGVDAERARQLASSLSTAFRGLCRGVEVGPAQLSDYEGGSDEAYGNRVFLRHYCVHLLGPDPARVLPRYQADKTAARGFNGDIGLRVAQWRAELSGTSPAALARRIARKTLFAVAGLVSVNDGGWTTDRVRAARRWGEVRPEMADRLKQLVSWGLGPPMQVTESEIQELLEGSVAEVVTEFERRIGLWGLPSAA
jgi:predicted nucleotidyltransferase